MFNTLKFRIAILIVLIFASSSIFMSCKTTKKQENTLQYRDLNKNGKLDKYEDPKVAIDDRISDLIAQMTIEEKAGQMFIAGTTINPDGSIGKKEGQVVTGPGARMPTPDILIKEKQISHMNLWATPKALELAKGINEIQRMAENSRLGIPVSIASDPRHYFSNNIFSMESNGFSQWPEQLGFAAIGDEDLMYKFGDIARQEYLAVGIRIALHPMADLATEPRWPRCSGSFGEDAALSAKMLKPYILGFQNGKKLTAQGVACMTKHFSGGGPQNDGLDSHFEFHTGQVYPGNNFEYHIIPFLSAFEANTASIMPYYGVPTDQTSENVGMSFNKDIITKLLRNKYKFEGVVCTDWGLISDSPMGQGIVYPARAWGAESLSEEDRVKKVIDAGCDQFGGENCVQHVISLIKNGKISEARIDQSLRRILKQKFELGLFDNPYVNINNLQKNVGQPEWIALGEKTQRRALTLLKNDKKTCPLAPGKYKIYVKGVKPEVAEKYGLVVDSPEEADFAIIRTITPWVPVDTKNPFAKSFHHGDLDFKGAEKEEILNICKKVPTIFNIYLDRPVVFPEINAAAKVVIADFGANDAALMDVIFGKAKPEGKLPFELPSSMDAVRNQKEDLPYDSKDPLYKFGFGLRY